MDIKAVYIHIPFCKKICSYCDFCKVLYNESWVKPYLINLKEEIKNIYNDEVIETLYIGGGSPSSLSLKELDLLFDILNIFKLSPNLEFTFECNINDLNEDLLRYLYLHKVNRLSIGIESFNQKKLQFMNRDHSFKNTKNIIKLARNMGFKNINLDLIYALPEEKLSDLKKDLKYFLKLKPEHLSTYSLIIEKNTLVGLNKIKPIEQDHDFKMYNYICKKLKKKGYIHYEISNYAKKGYESKHNLTYWHNLEYYGFGLSASGFVGSIRYENTKSLTEYLKGNYISSKALMSKVDNMENELILGFRMLKGVNLETFYQKYEENMQEVFPIKPLIKNKDLIYQKGYIFINPNKLYIMNEILLKLI